MRLLESTLGRSLLKNCCGIIVIGCLGLTVIACQKLAIHSDLWKQQQIETMYADYAREFSEVESISVEELKTLRQQEPVVLVDVRSPEERAVSTIPGSISVTEFEANLDRYSNSPIVVYCTIGYRSGKYAAKLLQQKDLKIFNLKGSILSWSHKGGELIDQAGTKTKKIHVLGQKWQLTAKKYRAIW